MVHSPFVILWWPGQAAAWDATGKPWNTRSPTRTTILPFSSFRTKVPCT